MKGRAPPAVGVLTDAQRARQVTLLDERRPLIWAMFDRGLSAEEERKLDAIRVELDELDAIVIGPVLDHLESIAGRSQ